MKRVFIPLLLTAGLLSSCGPLSLPSFSSSSSTDTSETTSSSSEQTTSSSESTSSVESVSSEESVTSEGTSVTESSTSEEESDLISILFDMKTGTDGAPITDVASLITVTGAEVTNISSSVIYQTSGTHVRMGSSRSSGTIKFTFSKKYQIKGVAIEAKSYSDSASSAIISLGDKKETVEVGSTLGEYATSNLANETDTLTITNGLKERLYLYGITLYLGVPDPVYPTSISLSPSSADLTVGRTTTLKVGYEPSNTNMKQVSFSSSDSNIASVDEEGVVTGVSVGDATITATALKENGEEITATSTFHIAEKPDLEKTFIQQTYTDYSDNNVYKIDSCPTFGDIHPLLIPVWFTDSSTYITNNQKKENVRDDIETAYFGSKEEAGWHSVKTFYEEESQGLLTIDGVTTPWYECGKKSTAYYSSSNATMSLVKDAVDWYFSLDGSFDRSYFDSDSDGYIDAVLLIYGAPDYVAMGNEDADNLWAYCYWLQDTKNKNPVNPGPNTFFWASYDFLYSQAKASNRAGSYYGEGDTSHCNVDAHTFIHEMGHVFGLEDYYDYGPKGYSPAAGFSMQDNNVGGHDPFSALALGWANPYIPTESCEITLRPFQSNHDLILLSPEWNIYDSAFDEYLLLELYTPTGLNEFDSTYRYSDYYPMGPNVPGIRLWHVDARLLACNDENNLSIDDITTNVYSKCRHGVTGAFNNSYNSADYGSALGSSYYDYNLLQLIRENTTSTYRPKDNLSADSLFCDGSFFDMASYQKQFVKGKKMNSGVDLGWSFNVSIEGSGDDVVATIGLIKE